MSNYLNTAVDDGLVGLSQPRSISPDVVVRYERLHFRGFLSWLDVV